MQNDFLVRVKAITGDTAEVLDFAKTIAFIDAHYLFHPTAFSNGTVNNDAGQNNGSCKIFAFAQREQLNPQQTLSLFGQYYQDVLSAPDGEDHANIRSFMQHGWAGIQFEGAALTPMNLTAGYSTVHSVS